MAAFAQLGSEDTKWTADSWPAYRHKILSDIESLQARDVRFDGKLEKIIAAQEALRIDIASLQTKSGLWGAVAGLIPVVVALAMLLIGGYGR